MKNLFLTFHGIGLPPNHIATEERKYWIPETLFREVILSSREAASFDDFRVVPTFDDGNRSDIDIAAPILADYGLHGIFFPCSGRVGRQGYLTADEIRALSAAGFEIGSHGVNHVAWKGLDTDALANELNQSKLALEEVLGREVVSAALPFGAYDAATLRAVRKCGYRIIYSSDPGMSGEGAQFRRRWSFRNDRVFDIRGMAHRSRSPGYRIAWEASRIIKSLR
jgi:peptidoglycan/xylan/chitin deacetylase (PgdA/CDA1 family)